MREETGLAVLFTDLISTPEKYETPPHKLVIFPTLSGEPCSRPLLTEPVCERKPLSLDLETIPFHHVAGTLLHQLLCLLHNVWKSAYTPYHQTTVDPIFPLMALSFTQVNLLKTALNVVVVVLVVVVGFVP